MKYEKSAENIEKPIRKKGFSPTQGSSLSLWPKALVFRGQVPGPAYLGWSFHQTPWIGNHGQSRVLPSDSALLGSWIGGKFQGPGAGGLGGQSGDLGVMYYY